VQDLKQEVHHSVMHFANFVQTFVMPVLLNVKNLQRPIVVKRLPKHAENVLLSAAKCNQLNFLLCRISASGLCAGEILKKNNGQTYILDDCRLHSSPGSDFPSVIIQNNNPR
jgi:hypothetical protein